MKNLIVLGVLLLASCETTVQKKSTDIELDGMGIKIYILDGCEYYGTPGMMGNNAFLTHKGNCSNQIHRCNCK